jgi:hypothetical protein
MSMQSLSGFTTSVVGVIFLTMVGNWAFFVVLKMTKTIRGNIAQRILEPYYAHDIALSEHHEAEGMPLIIYIAYQLARLIAYSSVSAMFWLLAVILLASGLALPKILASTINPHFALGLIVIAAVVYNFQAVRALAALKLLYISKVDCKVKGLTPDQHAEAKRAAEKAFGNNG